MEGLKYMQWDSHSDKIRSFLQELIITNNFADVTLVCEDQSIFRAHRNILSAGSQVLKDIFLLEDKLKIGSQHSVVHLRGVDKEEMQAILEYIYLGETTFPEDGTKTFLHAATGLGLKDCTEKKMQMENQSLNNDHAYGSDCDDDLDLPLETETEHARQINDSVSSTKRTDIPNKPRQITIGFDEVISSSKVKEEVAEEIQQCPDCEFESADKNVFKTHIEFAHDGVKYYCHDCDFKTTVSNELDFHIDSEHNGLDVNTNHQCAQCGKVLSSAKNLSKHEKLIHLEKREKMSCKQCTYQAFSQTAMYNHIQSVHKNINYPCESCGKLYPSNYALKCHVMKVHDKSVVVECDQCDYKTTSKGTLQFHISAKHDKVEFNCDLCDNKYSYLTRLKAHKKSVHEGKRYSCDSCSFQAAYKSDVKHIRKLYMKGLEKSVMNVTINQNTHGSLEIIWKNNTRRKFHSRKEYT